jgi:zinc transport system permease protein
MNDFFQALLHYQFLHNAFWGVFLASIACGLIGPFVVVKRIGSMAGGISHAVLGGMGIAYFFQMQPMIGALFSALVAAWIIGIASSRIKRFEDVMISAIWAVGMAIGIIFMSKAKGYQQDLMHYLFGNVLMISSLSLYLMAVLDVMVLGFLFIFYKELVAICFDEEYSWTRGINVHLYYLLLLSLVALTVVLLIQVVGLILVIALLSLPAAISLFTFQSLHKMMVSSCILGIVFSFTGIILSYLLNIPSGATIILVTGIVFFFSLLWRKRA